MNRRTFRILRAHPHIADVYVRGSFVRGPFVPIASDVDLVLVMRNGAGASYERVLDVHRCLRRARWGNISVRDWWQHMITAAEHPLVEAFWPVVGAEEWRRPDGSRPIACARPAGTRELSFAIWSQLCTWSGSVFHAWLRPDDRVHAFDSALKKSLQLSSLFAQVARTAEPLDADALAAAKSAGAAAFAARFRACGRNRAAQRSAVIAVFRALERAAAALAPGGQKTILDGTRPARDPVAQIIRSPDVTMIVLQNGLDDRELADALEGIDGRLAGARVTFVIPESAVRLFPYPAADLTAADGQPFEPPSGHAHERHLFDALFLPSLTRLSLAFPDAGARLARSQAALLRAVLLYGHGVFAPSARAARQAALEKPPLLGEVPGLEPLLAKPSTQRTPAAVFRVCARLVEVLRDALLDHARRSRPCAEAPSS